MTWNVQSIVSSVVLTVVLVTVGCHALPDDYFKSIGLDNLSEITGCDRCYLYGDTTSCILCDLQGSGENEGDVETVDVYGPVSKRDGYIRRTRLFACSCCSMFRNHHSCCSKCAAYRGK